MKTLHTETTRTTTVGGADDAMTRDSFGEAQRPGGRTRKAADLAGRAASTVAGAAASAARRARRAIDPAAEDRHWREAYRREPYYDIALEYEDYAPAYRTGYEAYARYPGRDFDQVADELRAEYESGQGRGRLGWERAKHAARAAWQRVAEGAEHVIPGDRDRDGC